MSDKSKFLKFPAPDKFEGKFGEANRSLWNVFRSSFTSYLYPHGLSEYLEEATKSKLRVVAPPVNAEGASSSAGMLTRARTQQGTEALVQQEALIAEEKEAAGKEAVLKTAETLLASRQIFHALNLFTSGDAQQTVRKFELTADGLGAWRALRLKYERTDDARQTDLYRKLDTLTLAYGSHPSLMFNVLNDAKSELTALECTLDLNQIRTKVFSALGESGGYELILIMWRKNIISWECLNSFQEAIEEHFYMFVLPVFNRRKVANPTFASPPPTRSGKCHVCQQPGHWANDPKCPGPPKDRDGDGGGGGKTKSKFYCAYHRGNASHNRADCKKLQDYNKAKGGGGSNGNKKPLRIDGPATEEPSPIEALPHTDNHVLVTDQDQVFDPGGSVKASTCLKLPLYIEPPGGPLAADPFLNFPFYVAGQPYLFTVHNELKINMVYNNVNSSHKVEPIVDSGANAHTVCNGSLLEDVQLLKSYIRIGIAA